MGTDLNQLGVELLCSSILRYAYNDLLDAMFAVTSFEMRYYSYNAHVYYEWLRTGRGKYSSSKGGKENAEGDVRKMEYWFRSARCKQFCKNVDGEWFIDQAKRHIERWKLDKCPEWKARPSFESNEDKKTTNRKREERNLERWREARDKWREEHYLKEVIE